MERCGIKVVSMLSKGNDDYQWQRRKHNRQRQHSANLLSLSQLINLKIYMIKIYKQLVCDNCQNTVNDYGNIVSNLEIKKDLIKNGGKFNDNKHFCSLECLNKYYKRKA